MRMQQAMVCLCERPPTCRGRRPSRAAWIEGLNETTIAKYIREQEAHDIALDKLGVKEHEGPFKGK